MKNAKSLLTNAKVVFPLSEMGPEFKGTHSITLTKDNILQLSVWSRGKCWTFDFDAKDEDRCETTESIMGLLAEMKGWIDNFQIVKS